MCFRTDMTLSLAKVLHGTAAMEVHLGLNGRHRRLRFYEEAAATAWRACREAASDFEQLEECLFPKVISVSLAASITFHFSGRHRKCRAMSLCLINLS